jgi:hypothetical protein
MAFVLESLFGFKCFYSKILMGLAPCKGGKSWRSLKTRPTNGIGAIKGPRLFKGHFFLEGPHVDHLQLEQRSQPRLILLPVRKSSLAMMMLPSSW